MKKRLLIFGYSGFVGPYLAKEFFGFGYEVYGTDLNDPMKNDLNVIFSKTNILNHEEVKNLISNINPSHIINLAAISSVGLSRKIPSLTFEVNVLGAINILESCRTLNISPKIMFIGSSEEYQMSNIPLKETDPLDANNPYGISKIALENIARTYSERYKMKIYCVRSFNHTGIGQKDTFVLPSFCKQAAEIDNGKKETVIKVGNLNIYRDFSDVRDVVSAYRAIIESNNYSKIYNVGSGTAYSLEELLKYIISLTTKNISIVVDSDLYRPIDNKYINCDNSLLSKDFGWSPKYNIKDTIMNMFLYYKGQ